MIEGFRAVPLLRALVPFVSGILMSEWLSISISIWPLVALLFLYLIILLGAKGRLARNMQGFLLVCFFLALGINRSSSGEMPSSGKGQYVCSVEKVYGKAESKFRNALCLVRKPDQSTAFRTFVLFECDSLGPKEGHTYLSELSLETDFPISVPGGFDKAKWARSKGVTAHGFLPLTARIHLKPSSWINQELDAWQNAAKSRLDARGLSVEGQGLARAILLGDRKGISATSRELFQSSGTVHILAVSGLHVGIIFGILTLLFKPLGNRPIARNIRFSLTVVLLWAFALLAGAGPSVIRATLMFSLFAAAQVWERTGSPFNTLSAAALLMLMLDPVLIYDLGFRLSFLAVGGILLFYNPIYRLLNVRNRLLDKVWIMACVSFSAQLATGPLVVYEFGHFPLWFLPANIVVVSIISMVVLPVGIVMLITADVNLLGNGVAILFDACVDLLYSCTEFFASLPNAYPAVRLGFVQMCLVYLVIMLLFTAWRTRYRTLNPALLTIALLLFSIYSNKMNHRIREQLIVHDTKELLITKLEGRSLTAFGVPSEWNRKVVGTYCDAMAVEQVDWKDTIPPESDLIVEQSLYLTRGHNYVDTAALNDIKHLVIDRDVRFGKKRFLTELCSSKGVEIHRLQTDGAFVLNDSTQSAQRKGLFNSHSLFGHVQ